LDKSIAGRLDASKKIDTELNTGTCSSLVFKMQYKIMVRKWLINAEKKYLGRIEWIIIECVQQGIGAVFNYFRNIYQYRSVCRAIRVLLAFWSAPSWTYFTWQVYRAHTELHLGKTEQRFVTGIVGH